MGRPTWPDTFDTELLLGVQGGVGSGVPVAEPVGKGAITISISFLHATTCCCAFFHSFL